MAIYRDSKSTLYVGLVFAIVPLCLFTFPTVYNWFTGTPMLIRTQSADWNATHRASPWEMLSMALMPLILTFFGALMIVDWTRSGVLTSEVGVKRIGKQGRLLFDARWADLAKLEFGPTAKGGYLLVLKTQTHRMEFKGAKPEVDRLVDEVKSHATQVTVSELINV
jgi:hypothetical protein